MNRAILAPLLLAGCLRAPTDVDPAAVFGAAFEECDPDEIRYLAGKHNFRTAFEPCGSNNFRFFSWSPDGRYLLFALTQGAYVLDAGTDAKNTASVPVEDPIGPGTWTSATRFALPLGPAEGAEPNRLALYDLATTTTTYLDLPGLSDPRDLVVGDGPDTLMLIATKDGQRGIWQVDLADGALSQPFPWAAALPVERFSYQAAQDALAIGAGGTVTLYDKSGASLGAWAPATRGTLHPGGRWIALEHEGPEISLYGQHSWDESTPARLRQRSLDEIEKDLPTWAPRVVRPPTISLVDRATGSRWVFTGFSGTEFQWYEAADYWASFIVWGFEGKELRRNVVLGDLAARMAFAERGEPMLGVERFHVEATP